MFVKISNGEGSACEWSLLEFQGEVLGELAGNELGQLEIKEVTFTFNLKYNQSQMINPFCYDHHL